MGYGSGSEFGGPQPIGNYDTTTPAEDLQAALDSLPFVGGGGGAPDFRPLKIADHAAMLQQMNDGAARAAAQMWANAATLLETTRDNMLGYGNALKDVWRSEAAKPFMGYIGGTLNSLEAWAEAARINQGRLNRLADAIQTAQDQMSVLYASYKSEVAYIDKDTFGPSLFDIDKDADDMEDMVNEKTQESLKIMETLAGALVGTTIQDAGKYAGPTDARPPSKEQMQRAMGGPPGGAPQAPGGGGAGAPPTAPGGAPPAPPRGARPQAPSGTLVAQMGPSVGLGPRPAAPGAPPTAPGRAPTAPGQAPTAPGQAPTAPGQAPQAPAPYAPLGAAPAAPNALAPGSSPSSAPARGPAPAPPPAPAAGMLGPAGAAPGRGPAPAAPVIGSAAAPSAGLSGARGAPPAAPSMASPGSMGPRGPAPAAPGAPGSPPMSPARSGLQGRNAPSAPGMAPPGSRAGSGPRPQIPGRGAPPGRPGTGMTPGSPGMGMPPGSPGSTARAGGPPARGGGPGQPTLPGRQAPRPEGAKPGGAGAPSGAGVPRSLQGTRGTTQNGRPLNGRGPIRPGSPASTGMPGLRGRGGPARAGRSETTETTRAALRRGLDGRGISTASSGARGGAPASPAARPIKAAPAKRRDEDKAAKVAQIVGDEELFVVESAAPAVIKRTKGKEPAKRPGPALGR